MDETEYRFWAASGARVLVDPVLAVSGQRHSDAVTHLQEPREGHVVSSVNGVYKIVDDDGEIFEARAEWLRIIR